MKKVAIIGASGMAGQEIYHLVAAQAELRPTGLVRDEAKAKQVLGENAQLLIGDVLHLDNATLAEYDLIIDAFSNPKQPEQQVELAQKLVAVARQSKARLIFVLGAGSLHTGNDSHLFVEDIAKLPGAEEWIGTPQQQLKELQFLQTVDDVDWVGISPSAEFVSGPADEHYVIGGNDLLFNADDKSRLTTGTMANVVVKEILNPTHHQARITVVNA